MPESPIGPQSSRPEDALTAIQQANEAVKSLNKTFSETYKGVEANKAVVEAYEKEILAKKKVSLKTIEALEKAQADVNDRIAKNTLAREEFIANKRIELMQTGLSPEVIEETIQHLKRATIGFQDVNSALAASVKLNVKPDQKASGPFGEMLKNITSGLGMAGKEGSKTSDILLSSIAGVASKILAAVGVFDLLRTAAQAWVAGTYLSSKAAMGFSQVLGRVGPDIDSLGTDALRGLLNDSIGARDGVRKLASGVNLLSEESEAAVTNFNKLISEGKVTRFDMVNGFSRLEGASADVNDRMLESLYAIDAWGRGIQAFGKSSEQGAEMAATYIQTFNLQGIELAEAFNTLSVNSNQAWQSIDGFDKAMRSVGERMRLSSNTSKEALGKAAFEVEKFGKFIEQIGVKANYSGAETSRVFDIMFNKINGMGVSFKLAALQASGLTAGLDIGQAAFKAYGASTSDLMTGMGVMFAKQFGAMKNSTDKVAFSMMQAMKIPEDQAHIVMPAMQEWAKQLQQMTNFQGSASDKNKMVEQFERTGKTLQAAMKEVAANKAIEDPLKAIQKILVNIFKMMGSVMNYGIAVKSATGAYD